MRTAAFRDNKTVFLQQLTEDCTTCPHTDAESSSRRRCPIDGRHVRVAWRHMEDLRIVVCDPAALSNSRVNALSASLASAIPTIQRSSSDEAAVRVNRVTETATTAIEDLFHNLRTYNAKIRQALNLVWRENADAEPEKIKRALVADPDKTLAAFRKAIKSSALITAEMRTWEQTLGEPPIIRPLRIHRLVKAVTMLFIGDLVELGVNVDWGRCDAEVLADNNLVITAMTHLVDNCVKYACRGSELAYRYEVDERSVTLEMVQTSAFVHPEERDKIWDRSYRGSEAVALAPGKGTGLGATRELLAACDATIELDSGSLTKRTREGKFARNIFRIVFKRAVDDDHG